MKAGRIHAYREPLTVDTIDDPVIESPTDVIVKIAGAGVCRTDLHIIEGIWQETLGDPPLPYTI
ncbi:MAG: alcohol dehydrogenase catalytic domain-containing protein, partial [Sulfobacillus thermotolerans]|nr:alcohol dehydrogenase catalytic domain-containing protein [Sulfobacillus thermotolerans]